MTLVWVTGGSGTGKSTVAAELRRRGLDAVDADDVVSGWRHRDTGAPVPSPPGPLPAHWARDHAWVLMPERLAPLVERARGTTLFLCGSVENERDLWDAFDVVVALVADDTTITERIASRTTNDYGKRPEQLADILGWNATNERSYRGFGARIVDATQPLRDVVDQVVAAAAQPPEEALPGGNVGGAVRVGDTVRRRTGPWTPAVHDLLRHLERAGLDGVPRVHGIDAQGREILDHLPGLVPPDPGHLSDSQLVAVGRWLARFHAASRTFPADTRRWYFGAGARADGEVICHHDVAPYNVVVDADSGELVGVIDWELASPGHPWSDVAFLAFNAILITDRPDADAPDVARRLELLVQAYDDPALTAGELAGRAIARMVEAADGIEAGQRRGDEGMLALARIGEPAATRARIERTRTRLPAILAALR